MSDAHIDYWSEAASCAFDEAGAFPAWDGLTSDQKTQIAEGLAGAHECHGMSFYQPPPSDRLADIERDLKAKYAALEREFEAYRGNAETAVKQALRQYSDAQVSIGRDGEVLRHGGRTERIQ